MLINIVFSACELLEGKRNSMDGINGDNQWGDQTFPLNISVGVYWINGLKQRHNPITRGHR